MAKKVDQVTEVEPVTVAGEDGAGAPPEQLVGMIAPEVIDAVIAAGLAAVDAAARAAKEQASEHAAAPDDRLLLGVGDNGLTGAALVAALEYPVEPHLIFGQRDELAHMRPVPVQARDFQLAGDRLRWTGNIEHVAGPEMGSGRGVSAVALALGPDGPVMAICDLSPFTWAAGTAFAFGPGAFVF